METSQNIICKRKFGKTTISIDINGAICVAGDWSTNWGTIYPNNIVQFKEGVLNLCTGFVVQVIGMDSELSTTHREYIHGRINAGKFDHLIEDI